jgi:hypothetical protein
MLEKETDFKILSGRDFPPKFFPVLIRRSSPPKQRRLGTVSYREFIQHA